MNITTEFNPNDQVFFMQDNIIVNGNIRNINIRLSTNLINNEINTEILYSIDGFPNPIRKQLLFNSAEKVAASLLKQYE
jgi:hypothetical protein